MGGIKTVQQQRIKQAVTEILAAIGDDPAREGLRDTPDRVARMYQDLFSGIGSNVDDAIDAVFEAESQDPVIVTGLVFYSVCEHHLLPFFGEARIGYVPNGKISGISKLARALEVAAHRPQVQERLTADVAGSIFNVLQPEGVIVELEAEHLCMAMRGVNKPGTRVLTSASRGDFKNYRSGQQGLQALMHSR
ncbi:MAG: GTP cyclohydrolase I FolE [Chloroflexi bacterium]|nr:GTP cyclohydrolase I FolE [Chloroflexota bacterium]MDA1270412.1 GTP cyclohydrolase I FolE [Chloroflexota bacterium]